MTDDSDVPRRKGPFVMTGVVSWTMNGSCCVDAGVPRPRRRRRRRNSIL
jgi:hypothetical protein